MLALTAASLITPLQRVNDPLVLIEDGVIRQIGSRSNQETPSGATLIDFGEGVLVPGLIDIHIHGGAGFDVMQALAEGFATLERFLVQHGVTTYFPTTVTAPLDATLAALDRMASAVEHSAQVTEGQPRARPAGIHLEGPFLSYTRRGVHPPEHLLAPSGAAFDRLWQAARGHVKLMTIAPELEGAEEVIAEATRRGVCVSMGHSDADLVAARRAVAAGARHATHTFNAMRPLEHRDPGILGLVLTSPDLSADIIADGVHLDPAVVDLFFRLKGPDRTVLITDAISATGMPDGRYRLGSFEVEVRKGRCTADGRLAGSVLTLDRAVRNMMQFAHVDLPQAVQAASLNPARSVGMADRVGALSPGAAADIVVLNSRHEVIRTIVRGTVV
jgi:N-acetylglucosamine-6-phosphate deacetylase